MGGRKGSRKGEGGRKGEGRNERNDCDIIKIVIAQTTQLQYRKFGILSTCAYFSKLAARMGAYFRGVLIFEGCLFHGVLINACNILAARSCVGTD